MATYKPNSFVNRTSFNETVVTIENVNLRE
jgi:hypothetical protein